MGRIQKALPQVGIPSHDRRMAKKPEPRVRVVIRYALVGAPAVFVLGILAISLSMAGVITVNGARGLLVVAWIGGTVLTYLAEPLWGAPPSQRVLVTAVVSVGLAIILVVTGAFEVAHGSAQAALSAKTVPPKAQEVLSTGQDALRPPLPSEAGVRQHGNASASPARVAVARPAKASPEPFSAEAASNATPVVDAARYQITGVQVTPTGKEHGYRLGIVFKNVGNARGITPAWSITAWWSPGDNAKEADAALAGMLTRLMATHYAHPPAIEIERDASMGFGIVDLKGSDWENVLAGNGRLNVVAGMLYLDPNLPEGQAQMNEFYAFKIDDSDKFITQISRTKVVKLVRPDAPQ
jgi:hypothetical protein